MSETISFCAMFSRVSSLVFNVEDSELLLLLLLFKAMLVFGLPSCRVWTCAQKNADLIVNEEEQEELVPAARVEDDVAAQRDYLNGLVQASADKTREQVMRQLQK